MNSMIVGITGASGVIYGVKILEVLSKLEVETHLIVTQAGFKNLEIETSVNIDGLKSMASHVYEEEDLTALWRVVLSGWMGWWSLPVPSRLFLRLPIHTVITCL